MVPKSNRFGVITPSFSSLKYPARMVNSTSVTFMYQIRFRKSTHFTGCQQYSEKIVIPPTLSGVEHSSVYRWSISGCSVAELCCAYKEGNSFPLLIEFNAIAWLLGLSPLFLFLIALRRRGGYYLFFFSVFWVYLLALVSVTVFPIPVGMDGGFQFKSIWQQIDHMYQYSGLNLTPLYFGNCWDLPRACVIGIQENILMTIPFGFGMNFIARNRSREFIWLAFGLGLLIESTQFALDLILGGAYRAVDANDVLFNGVGVWIGYGLFLVCAWVFMIMTCRLEIKYPGWLAFIQDVCQDGLAGTSELFGSASNKESHP